MHNCSKSFFFALEMCRQCSYGVGIVLSLGDGILLLLGVLLVTLPHVYSVFMVSLGSS